MEIPTSAIVFCRTRLEVDGLVENLNAHGYRAEALHGGMVQKQRDPRDGAVPRGETDLLVATTSAARGLDIGPTSRTSSTTDVPSSPEVYVHRIGRTGRVGRPVSPSPCRAAEHRQLRNIEAFTRQKIEVTAVPTAGRPSLAHGSTSRAPPSASACWRAGRRTARGGRVAGGGVRPRRDRLRRGEDGARLEEGEGGRSEEEIPVVSLKSDVAAAGRAEGPASPDAERPASGTRHAEDGSRRVEGRRQTTRLFIAAGRQAGCAPGRPGGGRAREKPGSGPT